MDSLGGQVDQRGFAQEVQNKFYANILLSFLQHHFNSILVLKNPSHDKKKLIFEDKFENEQYWYLGLNLDRLKC